MTHRIMINSSQLTFLFRKFRELVDVFHRVLTAWNEKAKLKVEALEETVLEVMSLDHTKLVDWFVTQCELYPETIRTRSYIQR